MFDMDVVYHVRVKSDILLPSTEQADMHVASYRVPTLLTVPGTMDLEQNIAVTLGATADAINARDFVSAIYMSHDAVFDKDKDMILVAKIDNDLGNFHLLWWSLLEMSQIFCKLTHKKISVKCISSTNN